MRNLLALIGLVVVGVAGAGWYLGWYKLGVDSHDPKHPQIKVEVERDKINKDVQQGVSVVEKEVQGTVTSFPVAPIQVPPLPTAPQAPPSFDPNVPVQIPAPPSFNQNK